MGKSLNVLISALFVLGSLVILSANGSSGSIGDLLVLQDIDGYKFMGKGGGKGSGMISATGHFNEDHQDESYGALYFSGGNEIGVKVEVTQHAGGDSDKWLLHEVDISFRNYYGIPSLTYDFETIAGNTILISSVAGYSYRWLSGNKVVVIAYTDLEMKKPQPTEIVRAYLAKHPSTLPPMTLTDLRSAEYKTTWIKDEMERRLWLCDKWLTQIGKADLYKILSTVTDDMGVFLDYRQKYYGISGKDDKMVLIGYLTAKGETSIKNKLAGYRAWWNANKTKAINLP